MRISALAKAAGCQTVTVRFYERKGLLGTAVRSESNYRVYGQKDLERLLFIRRCRSLGLTLDEIVRLIEIQSDPAVDCTDVNTCLDQHLDEIEQQIQGLKRLQRDLRGLRRQCAVPGPSAGCGVLSAISAEVARESKRKAPCCK